MKTNFYDSLNELTTDARFRSLAVTQNFESFLSTNGLHEAENMYTFSWLLQPRGSHGLQDVVLKEFFTTAWTMIHGQYGEASKNYKTSRFYTGLSPLMFQQTSFCNAFIDRAYGKTVQGADIVITDVASKTLIVVNNHFEKGICDKAQAHFNSSDYKHFDYKLFVSFDMEAGTVKDGQWMYMNNEWLINLCTDLIECPQYSNHKITGQLKDFYQFLTGAQYGASHEVIADYSASLVKDFYEVIRELRAYKAEKVSNIALIDINPREFATTYAGKISEREQSVLSLYWSYRNTFNTFFEISDLETVTRDLEKSVEQKSYNFDRSFIRNGLRFTPSFGKVKSDRTFMNTIFDVEMVSDVNKSLCLSLVINKGAWDRLTVTQRETIQKDFGFTGSLLKDRVIVTSAYYKQDWKNKNLSQDIVSLFAKVDSYLGFIGIRAA
jgi:hypothetical protein